MRQALFPGVCLAFVFVVESFIEDELFEDEKEGDARHHLKKCSEDKDCEAGECCGRYWYFWKRCFTKRRMGQPCSMRPRKCHKACQDGLVCRRTDRPGPHGRHHRRFKCSSSN